MLHVIYYSCKGVRDGALGYRLTHLSPCFECDKKKAR
jgi:hypothetical protein